MSNQDADSLTPLKRAIVEIRELKGRVAEAERVAHEPIAIVGMGLRFPGGATDPESFWRLLWDGKDAITEVPPDRWPIDDFYDPDPDSPGKMATRYGGFLPDIDRFDAPFFGISRREAESIDPQQRLLLEVAWEALEHAGIAADQIFGTDAGVFMGITNTDYLRLLLADHDAIDTYTAIGNLPSVAAGRLSYVLGVHGPAVAVDTACSASLAAVHLAVRSLRGRECDLALAGGVGLILTPDLTINFSQARMMASDGRCKTFDAAADGYVRSEGCGVVVLKRLSDAVAAGDTILATVLGSALNQDGRSGGLTAPNGPSQARVIAAALADAAVDPGAISYVETHGTGTPLGDPIEVNALGAALCQERASQHPLLIGSVKTNVGHLEAAAGIAGLIKVVLMLQQAAVPPHLHLRELNPHIAADALPIAIPTERTEWSSDDGERIAGVSSFGLSGTNAHVIVGEAPLPASQPPPAVDERPRHILTLSAKSPEALGALAEQYAVHPGDRADEEWADVAFAANTGRSHFRHRLAVVESDGVAARERLAAFARGDTNRVITGRPTATAPETTFLFTGHGSHYEAMGRQLYDDSPVFRAAIEQCDDLLRNELDRSVIDVLFRAAGGLDQMTYAQPALFCIQYALAELWRSWGVHPAVVAGHSAGEYAAAVVAGVLSLEDGLSVISARGRLMDSLTADGEMVAIFAEESKVAEAVAPRAHAVGIAAVNGPTTTVISGERTAVRAVLDDLRLDDDDYRRLDISVAAHSPLVEPILDEFEQAVARIALARPQICLVSSMTGAVVDEEIVVPGYWRQHLRQPVRFADVFATMLEDGRSTFVEIGPHPTLLGLGQRCWPDDRALWLPSLRRGADDWDVLLTSLAELYVAGTDVDWRAFDRPYLRRRPVLPTYPFQRESYWSAAARSTARRHGSAAAEVDAAWSSVSAASRHQAEQGPLDLQLDRYPERWDLLDELASAYTTQALLDLGLFCDPGTEYRQEELIAQARVAPTYHHLFERWLSQLAESGLLERTAAGGFRAPAALSAPPLADLLARAAGAFRGAEPLLEYIQRCGSSLAAVVSGDESALATLFPDGSYETVDFLYHEWAVARYFNEIVAAAVAASSDVRRAEPLRVLEIGAGTGGTSATVLPALPANRTAYTFTDVSDFFLARAAERFSAHGFVRYALLDIEREPGEQGFPSGGYDVVVAANVLHATRDLDATLRHVRTLLAPGGVLVAYEATRHPRWFDITTGLIEGWQRFEDRWRGDHPLLPAEVWPEALAAAGFDAAFALPTAESGTAILGQHVIVARAPGDETARSEHRADPAVGYESTVASGEPLPANDTLVQDLADALPEERLELLVDFVRAAIARVLRVSDPSRIQRTQPLLDLGFDSLMAVELRNVLRQGLSLERKLPATLVFDHPNLVAIARYLDELLLDAAPQAPTSPVVAEPQALDVSAVAGLSEAEAEAMLLEKLAEI
jgi:acyl transferase domain-containing protein/SAM-dependent methyltransferase